MGSFAASSADGQTIDMFDSGDHAAIAKAPLIEGVELLTASVTRFSYAKHTHDAFAFGAMDRGGMRFWHTGGHHIAPPRSVIAVNPGEVHDGSSAIPEGCSYRLFYVEDAVIKSLFEAEAPTLGELTVLRGPVLGDAELALALRRLHGSFDTDRPFPGEALAQQTVLALLLFSLFSRYGNKRLAPPMADAGSRHVKRARDYMAAHLSERIELKNLAAACGLSQFHLIRTFKRVTALSPHSVLFQLRLEKARHLLRRGKAPADVAAAVGFADQSHLTHRFKAAFGITPGQYGAAHRT